jgi:hypothetical protein
MKFAGVASLCAPLAIATAVLGASCATEQVRWDEATETVERVPAAGDGSRSRDKPLSAREYAARFPTDIECETEIRRIARLNVDLALQLLQACVDRGRFRRISALIDGPWVNALAARPEAAAICTRVAAARGGDVESDVEKCQHVGFPVATLAQVMADPEKAGGKVAILRAKVDDEHSTKKETRLVEVQRDETEAASLPTGRRVAARFVGQSPPSSESVLLVRVLKIVEDGVIEDGEYVTVVDVILSAPVAEQATF